MARPPKNAQDQRMVVLHGHIFKNAGTTLDWSLARTFGSSFLDDRDHAAMREDGAAHLTELLRTRPDLRAVSSHHLPYPLPERPNTTFLRCYLVRHPIVRARSAYYFQRSQGADTREAVHARELDFESWIEWCLEPGRRTSVADYQTSYLAGTHVGGGGPVKEFHFRLAIENMSAALIGVVDRYDESMVVLEDALRRLGVTVDLAYVPRNVGTSSIAHLDADVARTLDALPHSGHALLASNFLDLRLYHHARSFLDERIREMADFDARLDEFVRRCARLRQRERAVGVIRRGRRRAIRRLRKAVRR